MAHFCPNCGSALNEGAKFCPECGAPIRQNTPPQPAQPVRPQPAPAYPPNGAARQGVPAPGFSDRVNDPRILAASKKNRKAAGVFSFFLIFLPLIGFVAYSVFSDNMEIGRAVKYGGAISAVFLLFTLISRIRESAKKSYEATVIDKQTRHAYRHKNSEESSYYTEYVTVVRTTDGKKKKIVEREGSQLPAWEYLQIGDRFRYHPQFPFPYELYDKSKAPYLVCVGCAAHNPAEADCCRKCGLPLLK